jgi:anaerobic magnesium-protoporphyrin IX monomethyl ester cyclase
MKVVLIQIDLVMGSRILLSLLREEGYDVRSLQINIRYTDLLSREDLDVIYDYIGDAEVVGLSFNTTLARAAEQLAVFIKEKGTKFIVVGGNHVTALPEEAIAFSDIVVRYEAEITLPKVLKALKEGRGFSDIKGIVYKHGRSIIDTGAPEIVWDLDRLPFQCIDTDIIKFFTPGKKVFTPDKKDLFSARIGSYVVLASRGCPFSCTYCSNSFYHTIDTRFKKVRKRSVNNIIAEMEYALAAGFESFVMVDDNFFSFTVEEIELFSRLYKEKIKKPFSVSGINPNNFKSPSAEEKLKLLIDSGLTDIRVGIQSGSNRTLKMFNRGYKAEDLKALLAPIERNRNTIWGHPYDKLHVAVDFICDAIWEDETDKVATIKLAQKLLTQYSILFFTLVYLPGTKIFNLALEKGWIKDKEKDIYLRGIAGVDDNIYNRLLFLIAITKERAITLPEELIDHILETSRSNEDLAKKIIDSIIKCINGVEKYHNVNLKHAATSPYLTGFSEWTKTTGDVGRKVLFRNYHEPYG